MNFLNNISFKFKTIIGIAVIESILLAIIYFTSVNSLNQTNEIQIKHRAEQAAKLAGLSVRNSILTYDVANAEQFIQSMVNGPYLIYIHIKNEAGESFAFAGNLAYKNKLIIPDQTLEDTRDDGIFDVIEEIKISEIPIGQVELGLSVEELSVSINEVSDRIKLIAITEVILSALFSWLLGWVLTRRLEKVKEVAVEVTETGVCRPINDTAKDEIGTVANAFEEMAYTLLRQRQEIARKSLTFETVVTETPDGVLLIKNDGKIALANPAIHRIINCYKDLKNDFSYQSLIQLLEERIDQDDFKSQRWIDNVRDLNNINEEIAQESILVFKKPNFRYLEVSFKLVQDSDSGIHSILFFSDLTKTQEVERLKSAFLAHAAHELRTPLTSIQGFSELMMMQGMDETQRIELSGIINSQSLRVVEMVNDLLDISKIESEGRAGLNIEKHSLAEVVNNVVTQFKVPDHQDAPKVFIQHDQKIDIDASKIHRVVLNILSNAYKYGGEHPVVSIHLEPLEGYLQRKPNQGIQIRVLDNGIGMSPTQLSHIFDRFWRADDSGHIPGTGLGMSIVKEIVEMHNGEIIINSKENEGTEAIIRFFN